MEGFENVQVGEVRFRFVEVVRVRTAPAERLALGPFEAADVDLMIAKDLFLLGTKVFAYNSHDTDLGEIARGEREVSGGAA